LNRSGESGQPCLIPDFKGKGFSCSPFSMMLTIGLSYIAFLCWGTFFLFLVSSELLSWKVLDFVSLFLHLLRG
jgi:hypothetical protein